MTSPQKGTSLVVHHSLWTSSWTPYIQSGLLTKQSLKQGNAKYGETDSYVLKHLKYTSFCWTQIYLSIKFLNVIVWHLNTYTQQ